jgi:putative ABC transport system permease protein
VVAILEDALGSPDVLLPRTLLARHGAAEADAVWVRIGPGADPRKVAASLRDRLEADGVAVSPAAEVLAATRAEGDRANRFAVLVMIGLTVLYTMVAIANTMVMAVGERARELAALRLAGATVAQTLRVLTLETLTVVAVGVVFGGAAAAGNVIGTRAALGEQTDAVRTVVPWVPLLGIVAACGAAALLATLLPARLALRRHPMELAAVQE